MNRSEIDALMFSLGMIVTELFIIMAILIWKMT